jgi:hypothetical protein
MEQVTGVGLLVAEKNRAEHNDDQLADEDLNCSEREPTPRPRYDSAEEDVGHRSRIDQKQVIYHGKHYQAYVRQLEEFTRRDENASKDVHDRRNEKISAYREEWEDWMKDDLA